jgi:hypothetical protein
MIRMGRCNDGEWIMKLPRAAFAWVVLAATVPVAAADVPAADSPAVTSEAAGSAGVRAYIDPVTGRLIQRPVDPKDAAPVRSKSGVPLRSESLPDGTRVVTLDATYQHTMSAHRGEDHSLHANCLQRAPADGVDADVAIDSAPAREQR